MSAYRYLLLCSPCAYIVFWIIQSSCLFNSHTPTHQLTKCFPLIKKCNHIFMLTLKKYDWGGLPCFWRVVKCIAKCCLSPSDFCHHHLNFSTKPNFLLTVWYNLAENNVTGLSVKLPYSHISLLLISNLIPTSWEKWNRNNKDIGFFFDELLSTVEWSWSPVFLMVSFLSKLLKI